ncbi:MAG: T4 RnlA family RNA ligase [bacterium]|nr:T4 RnlA family RNA ligase [bacterium]
MNRDAMKRDAMKGALEKLVDNGLVKVHREDGLNLYHYSQQCRFSRTWTEHTRIARGIVLTSGGTIVAFPFEKFFNFGEMTETRLENLPSGVPEIAQKIDGTQITVFWHTGNWHVATSKMLCNDHTDRAEKFMWDRRLFDSLEPGSTYMFEHVGPDNRIVVPFDYEDMYLIGIRKSSGQELMYSKLPEYAERIGVPYAPFYKGDIRGLIKKVSATGSGCEAEGFVAMWPNGLRVKFKYEDYKQIHRVVTGWNAKSIWRQLMIGASEIPPNNLADEWFDWYTKTRSGLIAEHNRIAALVEMVFEDTDLTMRRKDIAAAWKSLEKPLANCLFMKLDGNDYSELIWQSLEPKLCQTNMEENGVQ